MFKAFFATYKLEVIAGLIIALSLFIGVHILNDSRIEHERDKAVSDLKEYKSQQKALAEKQILENKAKLAEANSKVVIAEVKSKQAIAKVLDGSNKTIDELTKKIRGRYETNSTKSNSDNGTGVMLPSTSSANAITEVAENIKGLSTGESVTDTTCSELSAETKDLEQACALTTIYFNQCRETLDADSLVLEREQ